MYMSVHSVVYRVGGGGGGNSVATPGKRWTRLSALFMVGGGARSGELVALLASSIFRVRGDHLEFGQQG